MSYPECPTCKADGVVCRATSVEKKQITRLKPVEYWDEEGLYHWHDLNMIKATWRCLKGHKWSEEVRRCEKCWCGE